MHSHAECVSLNDVFWDSHKNDKFSTLDIVVRLSIVREYIKTINL